MARSLAVSTLNARPQSSPSPSRTPETGGLLMFELIPPAQPVARPIVRVSLKERQRDCN